MEIHPLYFMIPATLCCSYAFMLPVATPPNAIVLAASNMKTTDMVNYGQNMSTLSEMMCKTIRQCGITWCHWHKLYNPTRFFEYFNFFFWFGKHLHVVLQVST